MKCFVKFIQRCIEENVEEKGDIWGLEKLNHDQH